MYLLADSGAALSVAEFPGPLLDRIDLQVEIMPVPFKELQEMTPGESSADIRKRVVRAREIQSRRFAGESTVHCNAQMTPRQLATWARPDDAAMAILEQAMLRFDMSARAYDRILKVARTIADLDPANTSIRPRLPNRRPPHARGRLLPQPRPLHLGPEITRPSLLSALSPSSLSLLPSFSLPAILSSLSLHSFFAFLVIRSSATYHHKFPNFPQPHIHRHGTSYLLERNGSQPAPRRPGPRHSYYDRAIYMVTLSKHKKCPAFGSLRYSTPTDAKIENHSIFDWRNSPLSDRYHTKISPRTHHCWKR